MQGVTPQAQTRQAVRKTTASELTPFSLICTLRPCHGRHSRGLAQRPTIRTRLFVGILRLVLSAGYGNSWRRLLLSSACWLRLDQATRQVLAQASSSQNLRNHFLHQGRATLRKSSQTKSDISR